MRSMNLFRSSLINAMLAVIAFINFIVAQDLSNLFEKVETSVVVIHTEQTDIDPENVIKYRYRESSRRDDIFIEKVSNFNDPDFWGEYNIIQPEESIQIAIERISRKLKRRER